MKYDVKQKKVEIQELEGILKKKDDLIRIEESNDENHIKQVKIDTVQNESIESKKQQ